VRRTDRRTGPGLPFGWVPVDDRAYDRAWQVQDILAKRGQHRSAGPVDLVSFTFLTHTSEARAVALT
jgi:hypothetical protein